MHLKHLKLQGYKSFATKTEFEFPVGITAIVGPNGSGKSNIADAIRWALGERSMSTLRAKSTDDMIFAGGHGRARAGMAEVTLTFDNTDGGLPIEFSEVTITRRAYRSSENEYLINGSQVLLRDITELLAESGLSERTYTVIGQGLVDAALSLRPDERRELFEEAAGISLYRDRREKTVERLDETERNLERVHDIISEVAPRMDRLQKDARQVEEHRRLTAHLERLQRTWYGYQWGRQQAELDRALERASNLKQKLETRQREAAELSERLTRLREREGELRTQLRDWYRESADLHEKADQAQRELAVSEERGRLLKARREELLEEIEPLKARREEQAQEVAESRQQVERWRRELDERKAHLTRVAREARCGQQEVESREQERAQVEQALQAHRAKMQRLDQALIEAREEISRLSSEQAVAEERARQLETRRREIRAELRPLDAQEADQVEQVEEERVQLDTLKQNLIEQKERLAELEREWTAVQGELQEPSQERAEAEQALRDRRAAIERLEQALRETQSEEAEVAGELKALERMRADGAAYARGVQVLLQADLGGVLGPLAGLMQVPSAWDRAIEAALGSDLQAVVVKDTSVVADVRRVLESSAGRLTLLPLDGLHPPTTLSPGTLCAADVVDCEARVRPAVQAVLGRVALCEDLAAARTLLPDLPPGSCCVTRSGIVLRADGALVVGEAGDGGLLADERARRELPKRLAAIRERREELVARRQTAVDQIEALEARLDEIDRKRAATREEQARQFQEKLSEARTAVAVTEETLRNQRQALQREESALERLRSQKAALRRQAEELASKHAAAMERAQALQAAVSQVEAKDVDAAAQPAMEGLSQEFRSRLEEAHRRSREIEAQQREIAERIGVMEEELTRSTQRLDEAREEAARFEREELAQARTEVAVAEESLRSQQSALKRELSLLEQIRSQVSARRERAEELEAERAALVDRVETLQERASRLSQEVRQIREQIRPAEEELERLEEDQSVLEERVQQAQDRVRDAEARHGRAQLEVERSQDELRMLARRIDEELGLVELELAESVTAQTPLPLRPLVSELPVVEKLPEGLEEEMQFLKTRLRRLGAVNPNAPDELAEVEDRYYFLTEQAADLEEASTKLRQAVGELDELMKRAFKETFDAVSERFSRTFTDLFGGGEARLKLVEPGDLLGSGIEIMAQPPGKRTQRLALLSGGERALTAAALLFSLLYVSPTPFCVLDEVDAMLDEANVGRFRVQLEALAQQTQFIVITHNRRTVEAADTIYGVSMGSDAVSQVVSLKLDEVSMVD